MNYLREQFMTAGSGKPGFTLKDKRKTYKTSVKAVYSDGKHTKKFYRSLDISVSGLSLSTEFPPEIGMELVVEFKMPEVLETVLVQSRVVRHLVVDTPGSRIDKTRKPEVYGFGIRFLELHPVQKQVIRNYVQADEP